MTEGGSVITESPKGGVTKSHMPIHTWWTTYILANQSGCKPLDFENKLRVL